MTNAMVYSAILARRFLTSNLAKKYSFFFENFRFFHLNFEKQTLEIFFFNKKVFKWNLEKMLSNVAFWKIILRGAKKRKKYFLYKMTFSVHIQLKKSTQIVNSNWFWCQKISPNSWIFIAGLTHISLYVGLKYQLQIISSRRNQHQINKSRDSISLDMLDFKGLV